MGKNIHVTKHGDHWSVMQEYAERSSGNFATQQEAFERAREIAKNNQQEVCIHGVNGKIRAKYSYALMIAHQWVKNGASRKFRLALLIYIFTNSFFCFSFFSSTERA